MDSAETSELLQAESAAREVKKLKRIASEWAGRMHDLAEEGLPSCYEDIPSIAQSTYDACKAWAEAMQRLTAK